jgi:hypothetical protein
MQKIFSALFSGVVFWFVLAFPAHAQTAHFNSCEVVEIIVAGESNAHVQLSCMPTSVPQCGQNNPFVAFDKSTLEGKQYLAVFMTAFATGARVSGYVYNHCPSFQPNVAALAHVRMRR